jgi:hypothetical protein
MAFSFSQEMDGTSQGNSLMNAQFAGGDVNGVSGLMAESFQLGAEGYDRTTLAKRTSTMSHYGSPRASPHMGARWMPTTGESNLFQDGRAPQPPKDQEFYLSPQELSTPHSWSTPPQFAFNID